jgi:hypothetical protein
MSDTKMRILRDTLTTIPRGTGRERRMSRVVQARRRLPSPRGGGRAWINGREVGGSDPRYSHLDVSHD